MNSFLENGIVLILLSFTFRISAQEIKVTEFRSAPRDISARENAVLDANGDACALIKTRTGLQNITFSSDLGIIRSENHEGEYWLWVSPNTSHIKIVADGVGNLEYKLPTMAEEYSVYIIFLSAVLPDKIIYKNGNTIRLISKPSVAQLYLDSTFMGNTPININIPSDTIKYEIRKEKFTPVKGNFVYADLQKEFSVTLKKDPEAQRMFFSINCVASKYGMPLGIQAGTIGKTGWYCSFVPPLRSKDYIISETKLNDYSLFNLDQERFSSITGLSFGDCYVEILNTDNSFFNHFRLKAGITQRVFKNNFLIAGLGWAKSTRYYRLNVIPYSSDPKLEIPLTTTVYGITESEINNLVLEIGFILRISNSYIINFNLSTSGKQINSLLPYNSFLPFEASFGIGYNF